ncbi:MAG: outer membrane lipoprotein carrier protein LolA [Bacteroidaceae bacterium]|nr:outer membrane lipoprotein carrier protein LolA [Bacteroidaceae bacterium]
MKRIVYILLLFLPLMVKAQNTPKEESIKIICNATAALKTLQADFVQTKTITLLGEKMVSKGTMYYQQNNKLRWEYTSPYSYTFVLNDSKVLLKKNNRSDIIDVNQNRMFKDIANIMMNSLVGKCLTDAKQFKTSVKTTASEYIITLLPQKKDMKQMFSKIILHFDRTRNVTVMVEMYEKSGDTTIIELQNIQTNKKINASIFSIQ